MNRNKTTQLALEFQLSRPEGQLGSLLQAIWSASAEQGEWVEKRLYSDAGSGIIFNLAGEILIGDEKLHEGVVLLPVSQNAQTIVLAPGAQLAGIRFHPGVSFAVFSRHFDKPTLLSPDEDLLNLWQLHAELCHERDLTGRIERLHGWACDDLALIHPLPSRLMETLTGLVLSDQRGQFSQINSLSQRQIERLFKRWLQMTPKRYQRILRIKQAIEYLQQHREVSLADAAHTLGFSDQAHMTREFRAIASVTPGQI